jgi:hypothetical protein
MRSVRYSTLQDGRAPAPSANQFSDRQQVTGKCSTARVRHLGCVGQRSAGLNFLRPVIRTPVLDPVDE